VEEIAAMPEKARQPSPPVDNEPPPAVHSPEVRSTDEVGISLDQLSAAFAQMLGTGDDPYTAPSETAEPAAATQPQLGGFAVDAHANDVASDAACELTPRSILEAMLFVGSPGNEPLTSQQVAELMRGVRASEVDSLVRELNDHYLASRCPYEIVTSGAGYHLSMRAEFDSIRQRFYGKARQARLSQAAIEVLSIVAYNQPISGDEIHRLRGMPSGALLTQLVRRELLLLERTPESKAVRYRTTDRFLDLFGLSSLADLPRSKELEN
jgi:segregation and condensation protein B